MLSINTNLSSLIAQRSMKQSTNSLNQAIERMTTGAKLNHAKDNAANYNIATNMTTKLGALQVAEDNCAMGLDLLATAEGSLNLIQNKLTRLRSLAVTAQNGTYGTQSLEAIESESKALISEIQREYLNCNYNGIELFKTESNENSVNQAQRVINQTTFISGETYLVDTSDDLVKLQNLVNSGVDTTGVLFELTNDIDMSGISFRGIGIDSTNCFKGTFDGKGHVISNLTINTTEDNVGLFGYVSNSKILNIGLKNVNIKGNLVVGGIVGKSTNNTIVDKSFCTGEVTGAGYTAGCVGESAYSYLTNLYFDGVVTATSGYVGGVVGRGRLSGYIENCYSKGTVSSISGDRVGGVMGGSLDGCGINYCYSQANVSTTGQYCGGIVGYYAGMPNLSFSLGSVNGVSPGDMLGNNNTVANNVLTFEELGFTDANGWKEVNGELRLAWERDSLENLAGQHEITLHIASGSSSSASIGFDVSFDLSSLGEILANGISSVDTISNIDSILEMLSLKYTEYGTIQNRLTSVLDEISTQYENLVSSRSTLQDADIAEVSSEYIRQQILQQASATLLSTANQSASIALSLI